MLIELNSAVLNQKLPLIPNPLASKKILVIGDIMLDVYINADVKRISPEAPVPILDFKSQSAMAGAAANVAANIVSLGSEATLISIIGEDIQGRDLLKYIGGMLHVVPYIRVSKERVTTVKTRYISNNHQMFRVDRETISPIDDDMAKGILEIIKTEAPLHDAVLISDYAKGMITGKIAESIASIIQSLKIPVIVDSKAKDYNIFSGTTVITPNEIELRNAVPNSSNNSAAAYIINHCRIKNILLTQGAAGMTLFSGDIPYHLNADAIGIVDVTGAGDTVAAIMAIGLANGTDIRECVRIANAAAGVVVRKPSVATVTREELKSWNPTVH